MFKTDELMKRVQDNLVTAKKRIEIVDKRRDIKHKKKFADNAHKKHVQAKHMQMIETSKKKKKQRPGKARRQNYKQKK